MLLSSLFKSSTMNLLTVVISVLLILSNGEAIISKLRGFHNQHFTNFKILENTIYANSVQSVLHCNAICSEIRSCVSCAYNSITGSCMLWNKDFVDIFTTSVVSEYGWMYYYLVKGCTITENMCLASGFIFEPQSCFCFKYLETRYKYKDSVQACAAMNAELAKIDSILKQNTMEKFLGSATFDYVRIQGELDTVSNTWKYRDGSKMKYFNWDKAPLQPDYRIGEITVAIRKSGYRWHDCFPSDLLPTICQTKNV